MSRQVQWSRNAVDDFNEQLAYIGEDSPDAAERIGERLWETAERLGAHPTGRPGRVSNTYEKSVSGLPYILVYDLAPETVVILRVIHMARDWKSGKWPS